MKRSFILLVMLLLFSTAGAKSSSDISWDSVHLVQDSVKQYSFLVEIDEQETEVIIRINDPLIARRPISLNITGLADWVGMLQSFRVVHVGVYFSNHTEAFDFDVDYYYRQFQPDYYGSDRFRVAGEYYLFVELIEYGFFGGHEMIGNYTTPVFQVQDRAKADYQFDMESQIEQGANYAFYLNTSDPYGEQFVVSQFQFQKTDSNIQQSLDFNDVNVNGSSWVLNFDTADLAVGEYNYSFVINTIDTWSYWSWAEHLTITGVFEVQTPLLSTGFELEILLIGLMVLVIWYPKHRLLQD